MHWVPWRIHNGPAHRLTQLIVHYFLRMGSTFLSFSSRLITLLCGAWALDFGGLDSGWVLINLANECHCRAGATFTVTLWPHADNGRVEGFGQTFHHTIQFQKVECWNCLIFFFFLIFQILCMGDNTPQLSKLYNI